MKLHQDILNYLAIQSSQVLKISLAAVNVLILARFLGPSGLGEWALISSAAAVLNSFLIAWTQISFVKFGVQEWKNSGSVRSVWSNRLLLLVLGVIFSLFLLIVDPFDWLNIVFGLSGHWHLYVFICFLSLLFLGEVQALFQSTGRMNCLAFAPIVATGLLSLFYAILLLFVDIPTEQRRLAIISGTVIISAVFWGGIYATTLYSVKITFIRPRKAETHQILLYSWPLMPGFLIGYLSDWGDQLLINAFFSKTEVGIFHYAYQIMYVFVTLSFSIGTVVFPRLVALSAEDNSIESTYIEKMAPSIICLWIVLIVPVITFLPLIFTAISSQSFSAAEQIAIVLFILIPGEVITQLYGVLFKVQGRLFRMAVVYYGIMTVSNLAISYVLLRIWGVVGSAIGTSISYLICQFLFFNDQHKYLKVSPVKIYLLFSLIIFFGVGQAMIGSFGVQRVLFSIIFLLAHIFIIRYFSLVDIRTIDLLFGAKFPLGASFVKRVLMPL